MRDEVDIDARPYVPQEFYGTVDLRDGRPLLVPTDPARWVSTLRKLAGVVKLTIQKPRRRRSVEANNYLFGVVYVDALIGLRALALDAGETCPFANDEEFHEAMKHLFFGMDVVKLPDGSTMEVPPRSRFLNSKQFAAFVDFVRGWCAERNIYTRDPGEVVTA